MPKRQYDENLHGQPGVDAMGPETATCLGCVNICLSKDKSQMFARVQTSDRTVCFYGIARIPQDMWQHNMLNEQIPILQRGQHIFMYDDEDCKSDVLLVFIASQYVAPLLCGDTSAFKKRKMHEVLCLPGIRAEVMIDPDQQAVKADLHAGDKSWELTFNIKSRWPQHFTKVKRWTCQFLPNAANVKSDSATSK